MNLPAGSNTQNSLLQNLLLDVSNFQSNASRVLRIYRRSQDAAFSRQIGYRTTLADGTLQTVTYNCTSPPCLDTYDFQIDRIDNDVGNQAPMIRARFTLEALIAPGRSYAFFFEGCCRPPQYNDQAPDALSVINNYGAPFHVRAEVLLAAGAANPTSSIKFVMPDQARVPPPSPFALLPANIFIYQGVRSRSPWLRRKSLALDPFEFQPAAAPPPPTQ